MTSFAVRTAGESHGAGLVALVEGVPFGMALDVAAIDAELARRQRGFGRSSRMKLEHDRVEVLAGLVHGKTNGAPLVLRIGNVDRSVESLPPVLRPRPGHADHAGAERFATTDARPVLERASARETAARVAGGAVARQVLEAIGVEICGYVVAIGGVGARFESFRHSVADLRRLRDSSAHDLLCPVADRGEAMADAIRAAGARGETLGGVVEIVATGVPAGLGSLEQWFTRLDSRIAAAMMSIPSAKAVEIGDGLAAAGLFGSQVHDAMSRDATGRVVRASNRAGGIEGGMSNGEPIVVRTSLKPLATMKSPLPTIDLRGGLAAAPDPQRSDVCAVPAGSVVGEAMLAIVLAGAVRERFGGPTLEDVVRAVRSEAELRGGRLSRSALAESPDPPKSS